MPRMLVEMLIDGLWTDITEDVRQDELVTVIRGRRNEGAGADPGRCVVKLNNRSGKYGLRNPLSPYYGRLERNAGLRVWLQGEDTYFWAPTSADSGRARVASSTALDVTADLDVRVEVALDRLPARSSTGASQFNELIGRYNTTGTPGQRMWRLVLTNWGRPRLTWSTDGDDTVVASCDRVVPYFSQQRFALRAQLDVDNGAGGHTAVFSIAPTLAGPWQPLGEPVTVAGVTSINQVGDASLEVGNINTLSYSPGQGRYYGAELRDGLDGPLLAAADFTTQTPGASSFTDAQGNTWLIELDGKLTDYYRRFLGNVSSWPVRWDDSGADSWVNLEANGILRAMSQGKRPLQSTLRRFVPTYDHLLAYWPMEDGTDTSHATPVVAGTRPLAANGLAFGADSTLPSSAPLPTVSDGASLRGALPSLPDGADEWRLEMVYFLDELPTGSPAQILAVDTDGGGISRIIGLLSDQGARLELYDEDGKLEFFADFADPDALADAYQGWSRLAIRAAPDGAGDTEYRMLWTPIGDTAAWWVFRDGMAWTVPTRIRTSWGQAYAGLPIGHLTYSDEANDNPYGGGVGQADSGWNGENTLDRVRRLADEENERLRVIAPGIPTESLDLGPQRIATGLQLLQDVAAADGGVLHELRDWSHLQYLPRAALYNRPVALTLDQNEGLLGGPLRPVFDDQRLVNEMTVTRRDGASATVQELQGPLSVNVIGFKEDAVTLNLHTDDQAEPVAAWRVHLGTVDEDRIPKIVLNLRNPQMAAHAQAILDMLVEQSRIVITNPPAGGDPGPLDLIVEGYEERFDRVRWTLTLTCSPASPWTVAETAGDDPGTDQPNRADTTGSILAADAGEADTQLLVHTTAGPEWVTSAGGGESSHPEDFPFDLRLGGEVVRVIDHGHGLTLADTFTRTVVDSWGTASSGHAWVESGGPATDRAVTGTAGTITLTSPADTWRIQRLAMNVTDAEIEAIVSLDQVAAGSGISASILMRYQDLGAFYALRVYFYSDGMVWLGLYTSGEGTVGGSFIPSPYSYSPDQQFRVRTRIDGQRVRARVWPLGGVEPDTWLLDLTTTVDTIASGDVGILAFASSGVTNVDPVVAVDDFELHNRTGIEPMAHDTFGRTVVDGWGTADSGAPWRTSGGGGPPDFDVNGSQGTIHLPANQGLLRFAEIVQALGDAEILTSIAVDQLPASGDYLAGAFFRAGTVGGSTVLYWVNLALQANSQVGIEVRNGTTPVGARVVTPLTYAPGTRLLLRARVDGHRLRGRVWIAGTLEPGDWTIDRTITTDTVDTGTLGVTAAATEASTPLFTVDDFAIVSPQHFTVTRAINGIVKEHSAGADIALAQPMIVPL